MRTLFLCMVSIAVLWTFSGCKQSDSTPEKVVKTVTLRWYNHMKTGPIETTDVEGTIGENLIVRISDSPLSGSVNPNYIALRQQGIGPLLGSGAFGSNGSAYFKLSESIDTVEVILLDPIANDYYAFLTEGGLINRDASGIRKIDGTFVDCGELYFGTGFISINEALERLFSVGSLRMGSVDFYFGCKSASGSSLDRTAKEVWIDAGLPDSSKARAFTEMLFKFLAHVDNFGSESVADVICKPGSSVLNDVGAACIRAAYAMKD